MLKTINIDSELHKELRIYAATHGTTVKDIVEGAVLVVMAEKAFTPKIAEKKLEDDIVREPVLD